MPLDRKHIDKLMKCDNWTMAKLAKEVGIARPNLWRILHRKEVDVKVSTLQKLAKALGVPDQILLTELD